MIGGGDRVALRQRGYIGDTATGALVAADGTIDWFCPRRFDAPPTLFRLLDPLSGGVRVGPAGELRVGSQEYDRSTNLLRTVLPGTEGEVEVLDFMPWDGGSTPAGRIVRIVTARGGAVTVDVHVVPGAAFGPARRVHPFSAGIAFDGTVVRTPAAVEGRTARFTLAAGERAVITIDPDGERHQPLPVQHALDLAARTADAWRRHLAPTTYDGPYRAAVERSLLVLKALTGLGNGAVVAAPTTSLPERVGGERNWDYRYAWIRDSSMAIDAAYDSGLEAEAEGFAVWLADVLRDAALPLRPLYRVDGTPVDDEETEVAVAGWRRSQPVRVGNAAAAQLQLDMYGELFCVLHEPMLGTDHPLLAVWDDIARVADWLADTWQEPDAGIWELRCEPRQLVASKLNAWFALEHLGRLGQRRSPLDLVPVGWRLAARDVLEWLEANAVTKDGHLRHASTGTATGTGTGTDTEHPDAALLRVVWRGPWPVDHPIVNRTVDSILTRLSNGPFVHRYGEDTDDGLPPGEGAFVPASFWAVQALAGLGRWEEAHERMGALVDFGRPLGLLPEEADPASGEFLGNLPQAFSHLALVHAALALTRGPR